MKHLPITALLALTGLFLCLPAMAQTCNTRADMVERLANKYNEHTIAVGIEGRGGIVEILTSQDGRTWTMIVSYPNGCTMPVAEGENWQVIESPARISPSSA